MRQPVDSQANTERPVSDQEEPSGRKLLARFLALESSGEE